MQSAAARLLAWGALRMVFGTLWTASAHNAWRERPPFGPTLDTPAGTIQVTLAHTAGSVACAFSLRPAGLDIERIRDVARMRTIAARHARAVIPLIDEALSEAAARRHFFKAWGLVESAVKMSRDGRAVAVADQLRDGELRLADNLGQCLTGAFEELPPNDDAPLGTILTAVPASPRETGATVLFSIFGSTFFEMLLRQERD